MKKCLKRIAVALLAIFILVTNEVAVLADGGVNDQISPYYTNCDRCVLSFSVIDPGEANVTVSYSAIRDVFSEARITVKIQKKFLLLFWKTVDIGLPNNEWTVTSTDVNGYFHNSFAVDGTGTYRANFTVEIVGTDGSVDLIEETKESKYS